MSELTNTPPEFVPSIAEYVAAFQKIESQMTENQRKMLEIHAVSPCYMITARELAQAIGYLDYEAVNAQYGRLGSMVADAMGIGFRGVSMLVILARPGTATNEEWNWVMRTNVIQALETLGWIERTSHLFYPQVRYWEEG